MKHSPGVLRPGNAGSGTATDHVAVLDDALAQLPIDPTERRGDRAGRLGGMVTRVREGLPGTVTCVRDRSPAHRRHRIVLVNLPKRAWSPAISADGTDWREHAEVVEITHLVGDVFDTTRAWPSGLRMIARREQPHPGAQLTFTDIDGHRYQVFVTDLADPDIAYLEALYRGRGRAEQQICDTKATGLTNLPSHSFAINHAWLQLTLGAHDLLAWTRLSPSTATSPTPNRNDSATACSTPPPASPRTGRRTTCRLAANWPWTPELVTAFDRVHQLRLRC